MNITSIIYLVVIVILAYVMYSYISSYNQIVDELKKIRLKCIKTQNNQTTEETKSIKNKKTETEEAEENEETEENEENERNDYIIKKVKGEISDKDIQSNNLLFTGNDISEADEENQQIKNDKGDETQEELLDFTRLSKKKNLSYSKNNYKTKNNSIDNKALKKKISQIIDDENDKGSIEPFQNFQNESKIEYWKPYEEDIQKTTEGFMDSPYQGYNKELYEPFLINSNSINPLGYPSEKKKNIVHNVKNHNQIQQPKSKEKWCTVDSINKICVPVKNGICVSRQDYDTQFECQGYSKLGK